jgi:hypothetical protein
MGEGKASFEHLVAVMPEGWEDKAKELGALLRSRGIRNATDLSRLVFLYLTEGKSFSGTAALLKLAGIGSMTKRAVFTRFQKCAEWLRGLGSGFLRCDRKRHGLFFLGIVVTIQSCL